MDRYLAQLDFQQSHQAFNHLSFWELLAHEKLSASGDVALAILKLGR